MGKLIGHNLSGHFTDKPLTKHQPHLLIQFKIIAPYCIQLNPYQNLEYRDRVTLQQF